MATIAGAILQSAGLRPGASGILFQSDNAADIGAAAANRPRDLHLGRNAAIAGTLAVTGAVTGASFGGVVMSGGAVSGVVSAILDQGAADGEILTLRSSDVAHGMTGVTDTTTYGFKRKYSGASGGLEISGLTEANVGIAFNPYVTTEDATRSTAAVGALNIQALLKSGTSTTSMSADRNILVVGNNNTTRFILDTDGDSHQDVGTAWTNFHGHNDLEVLHILSAHVTRKNDPLRKHFVQWLKKDRSTLEQMRLVSFNDDGHHFVNMSRLQMLTVGAVQQVGTRQQLLERVLRQIVEKNPGLVSEEDAIALLS